MTFSKISKGSQKTVAAVFHLRKTWTLNVLQDFRDTRSSSSSRICWFAELFRSRKPGLE